jgi:Fe-S-cluster-containing hydrogenase component 2
VLDYLRPDRSFGEIACIGNWEEIRSDIPADLLGPLDNRRTTSCTALDDVELVRIDAEVFRRMLKEVPAIKQRVVAQAKDYLSRVSPAAPMAGRIASPVMQEFAEQGLYNAQRLLVLDLEACTRCDECTKACSDTHDGITRLIREGLRFGKWLVASSCRSCTDPYCLVGCPVDAIHRIDPNSARRAIKIQPHGGDPDQQRMEIQIEDNCIGCGLCAENCPYGNINMHGEVVHVPLPSGEGGSRSELGEGRPRPGEGRSRQAVVEFHATTCDLCGDIVGNDWRNVSCVHACPHEAAFRMKGEELLKIVGG